MNLHGDLHPLPTELLIPIAKGEFGARAIAADIWWVNRQILSGDLCKRSLKWKV